MNPTIGRMLSEVLSVHDMDSLPAHGGHWGELMEVAQLLNDLGILDTNELMRRLNAVYVVEEDASAHLAVDKGKYYFGCEDDDDDAEYDDYDEFMARCAPEEPDEPQLSPRKKAILAQREKNANAASN